MKGAISRFFVHYHPVYLLNRFGRLYRGSFHFEVGSIVAGIHDVAGLVPPLLLEAPKRAVKL